MKMTTQISPSELQLLIFRYLKESGFEHSAYVFAVESSVASTEAATADVPPGTLVSFVHKGGDEIATENGASGVLLLKGHGSAVFTCAFHPKDGSLIASGAGDSSARIWRLKTDGSFEVRLLEHNQAVKPVDSDTIMDNIHVKTDKDNAVLTLAWSPDGSMLTTGCHDGRLRLWSKEGDFAGSLLRHTGNVLAVKWSPSGKFVLSLGQDKTVLVWDIATKSVQQAFELPQGQALDVDWRPSYQDDSEDVFAAICGKSICICRLSNSQLKTFQAHGDEINVVRWSPDGKMLASCSDDKLAKVWTFQDDDEHPSSIVLEGHTKEVYTLRWSPSSADKVPRLATASFDGTIKIWDVISGKAVHELKEHVGPVYAIEFDSSGNFLLSGGNDKLVNIWNSDSGEIVKSVKMPSAVFDLSWNVRGDKYAVALRDSGVAVVDF